jgi:hypothetical protein
LAQLVIRLVPRILTEASFDSLLLGWGEPCGGFGEAPCPMHMLLGPLCPLRAGTGYIGTSSSSALIAGVNGPAHATFITINLF